MVAHQIEEISSIDSRKGTNFVKGLQKKAQFMSKDYGK